MDSAGENLEPFDCPRCGSQVTERFWGPCDSCRRDLVAMYVAADPDGHREGPGTTRFEPAMHVVPNHVATKD